MKPEFVWVFDQNRRVYPKDGNGGPIPREHWRKRKVVGETSRSWVLEYGTKVPKKNPHWGFLFSETELDEWCWDKENRYKITVWINDRAVNTATLRKVADLIGYREGGSR